MIREPSVSGLFYDDDPDKLKIAIEKCFKHDLGPGRIPTFSSSENSHDTYGAIAPHAGYSYSGPIAAHSYCHLVENGFPETFIIISPNHTGLGSGVSIFDEGTWNTPLGSVEVDSEFSNSLIEVSDVVVSDYSAHLREHGCEVHLPFLQYFSDDFKIVPIVMGFQDLETSQKIADEIVTVAKDLKTSVSIIASTDLTHYSPQDIAYRQDRLILNKIAIMDENGLIDEILNHNITICGYGPTIAAIKATRKFGAKNCDILKYATSGDISGDLSSVVGYCSGIFK